MEFSSPAYEAVRRRLQARFAERHVEPWWQALPTVVTELSDRWGLAVGSPVAQGNTSLVLRCERRDGSAAMLKLVPDRSLAVAEATSLRSWRSSGRVPAVWGDDADLGALLLEAIPGETSDRESHSRGLASALGIEHARLWAWCSAFAAMLAAGRVARGASGIEALVALAP